jgi:hypothetical protein
VILVGTAPLAAGSGSSGTTEGPPIGAIGRVLAAQVRYHSRANVTMSAAPTVDGGVLVDGSGDDLTFRKTVRPNGTFTLEIASGSDHVEITTTEYGLSVTRNRRLLRLTLASNGDEELSAAARLLADSRAIRRLRTAAGSMLESEDTSPSAAALLLSDAMVGMLAGDPGAPSRVARHFTKAARSRLRRVSQDDCYYTWERRVMRAMGELEACIDESGPLNTVAHVTCSARWYLMVESYWVSFLTCSGWKF